MRQLLLALALVIASLQAMAQTAVPDSVAAKLDEAIGKFKEKLHAPGLAIAIVQDNDIVYSLALGITDLESKTPVNVDSRFPIMSITKTFTATLLMQMVEKGIVGLHDNVTKYVPEYQVKTDNGSLPNTTLLQLATHTAGLPRNSPADISFTESFDRYMLNGQGTLKWMCTDQELLKTLKDIRLDYLPYDFMAENNRHYSNLGYSLLGIALQRAAKANFAPYLVQNICAPLQMTNTGFLNEPGIYATVAKGYRYRKDNAGYGSFPEFVPNSALYNGSMYSTARDLCRYLSFHMKNDKVLSAESKAMMLTQHIGWKVHYPFAMHEGSLPGYRSMVVFNPVSKLGWVILTNVSDVDFNPINSFLEESLRKVYSKKRVDTDINKYAGTYALPQQLGSITITVKNDSLYSTYLHDLLGHKPLTRKRGHLFKANGSNEHSIGYDFVPDEQGNIKALRLGQLTWYKQ